MPRPRAGDEAAPGGHGGVVRAALVVDALVHAALLEREVRGQAQDLAGGAVQELLVRRAAGAWRRPGRGRRARDEVLYVELPVPVPDVAQPEVRELDVAAVREEDVVGLEVAVDDVPLVEVLEGEGDLGDVEARHPLVEEAVDGEQRLEVAPDEVLHDEEHVVGGLEAVEEAHDEGGLRYGQGVPLGYDLGGG